MHRRRQTQEENVDSWLMSYADMITLLLAFFIIYVSTSEPRQDKLAAATRGMQERFGSQNLDSPYDSVYRALQGVLATQESERFVAVDKTPSGLRMELASGYFFLDGTAEMTTQASVQLRELVATLKQKDVLPYTIWIEGYTDDSPLKPPYADYWELSAARAAKIARILQEQGIDEKRLRVLAYGRTHAAVPNRDPAGKPIPENRARNNRIVVKIEKQ